MQPESSAPIPALIGSSEPNSSGCKKCGSEYFESGYQTELCGNCRLELSQRPFPGWIRITGILVLFFTVSTIAFSPYSLKAGIAFERGKRAEKEGQYSAAVSEYEMVIDRFPDSSIAIARLGMAYYRSNRFEKAIEQFLKLRSRKLDAKLANEITAAIIDISVKKDTADGDR